MKIGDVVENGIWITGDEPEGMRLAYERDVEESMTELCDNFGFFHSKPKFQEKLPGSEDTPPVPDHIQGSKVRLLIAEATVIGNIPVEKEASVTDTLDKDDLDKLRIITRRAYAETYGTLIGNNHCDEIINQLTEEVILEQLTIH